MTFTSWFILAIRESRGSAGRLLFFVACLAVGVAAVVSVAGLSAALDDGIQARARELLAADIEVKSRRPIADDVATAMAGIDGVRTARVVELASVVSVPDGEPDSKTPGSSTLCELKAVDPGYPFYGRLELRPDQQHEELLDREQALVGAELLTRLAVTVGSTLKIGDGLFRIAGVVDSEPDRLEVSFTLGPRVLLSMDGLERTGLLGLGSRVTHKLLAALPDGASPEEVSRAAAAAKAAIVDPAVASVETYVEAQPALRRGLDRVESFLGLVALLSLLIGGIGVAQAVRAWISGRIHAIAILRALGVRPGEVFALYLGQTTVLALIGSTVGAFIGSLVASFVPKVLAGILPVPIDVGWQVGAVARGIGLGLGVALLFALRPLFDVTRVRPVRVLRQSAEPLSTSRPVAIGLWSILIGGIAGAAAAQSGSVLRGFWFASGIVAATAALTFGAWLVMRTVAATPRRVGSVIFRHGLAALARPGSGTLGAVVALGLGVVTVLGMHLVQERLSAELDADLPANAPTAFLIDIQPDQWPGVQEALHQADAVDVDSVEVVMARLRTVAGVSVSRLAAVDQDEGEERDRRWVLTREQRLTSLENLPEDNVIVEGSLWSHPDRAEISIEKDFADDLGVEVGDSLVFDIQGVELELLVSSIRTVDWGRFTINFFLVVEPGVLDNAPRFRIASARVPQAKEADLQNQLAAMFPNVTLLRLREVLEKVVSVLEQVGFGVRLLGGFTVLAGIAILGGAISAQAVRRGREVALYKTLGMTRVQVASVFAVEYALVGLVAGAIGAVGAMALAYSVTRFGMEINWAWAPAPTLGAIILTVALSIVAGLSASARALAVRPLAVLRQED